MELDLPEEIIQHVQSFLHGEKAARTCLLSKSWYQAWSTRPILVFDLRRGQDHAGFWNYIRETMKRYKQSNLKLQKLDLRHYRSYYDDDDDCGYSGDKLIADASVLGITELDLATNDSSLLGQALAIKSLTKLSVDMYYGRYPLVDLDGKVLCSSLVSLRFHTYYYDDRVVIDILRGCPLIETLDLRGNSVDNLTNNDTVLLCPRLRSLSLYGLLNDRLVRSILFGSHLLEKLDFEGNDGAFAIFPAEVFAIRSLTRLSISDCKILVEDLSVLCSHLLSLSFLRVHIGDKAIRDILSGCPLVEYLDIKGCNGMSHIDVSTLVKLVDLSIADCHSSRPTFPTNSSKVSFGSVSVPEFHRLRSVSLKGVIVDNEFFTNLYSRFPRLEDLTLQCCIVSGCSIQISSRSLKCIHLYHKKILQKVEFNVPNIRKFVFNTTHNNLPLFSILTESREWESQVELSCSLEIIESSWFIKLREFLKELSLSRISLSINMLKWKLISVKDLPCSSLPVVENFMLNHTSRPVTHDLLCALFRCCRPTCISMRGLDSDSYSCPKLLHELFIVNQKIKNYAECFSTEMQSLLMYDLEEIHVKILKENEWQSTPLPKFVKDVYDKNDGDSTGDNDSIGEMCFRFKWGAFRCVKSHEDNIPRNTV